MMDLILYNQGSGIETQQSAKHVLAAVPLADLNALALRVDLSQSRYSVLRALGNPSAPVLRAVCGSKLSAFYSREGNSQIQKL